MGKLYARSAKGRTAILPSPTRGPRSRGTTSRGNTGAKTKDSGPWTSPPTKQPSRVTKNRAPTTRRRQIPSNTQDESYGSGKEDASESAEDADDDDDEEDEDDEDPNVFAPSHAYLAHQTGPQNPNPHNEEALFGSSDDEDDDVYEAVNDVSDSEDDGGDERVESYVVEDIMAEGLSDLEAEDMAILDLDHFEGMTEWGFGGDLDTFEAQTPFSDDSESTMTEAVAERHVHWGNDVEPSNILGGLVSPLLTRALLPSARPIEAGTTGNDFVADMTARTEQPTTSLRHGAFEEYDSMLLTSHSQRMLLMRYSRRYRRRLTS